MTNLSLLFGIVAGLWINDAVTSALKARWGVAALQAIPAAVTLLAWVAYIK